MRSFEEYSKKFFNKVEETGSIILLSNVALDEVADAPKRVQDFAQSLSNKNIEQVFLDDESRNLALKYIGEKVVGETSLADCFHIAIATISKADLLVSWNFKHIVNIHRIRGYNGVNLICGYPTIEIRNPREAFDYEG